MSNIPKIIHYCWFGKGKMPKLALKCIESWKKYLPDYEIKEWNEDNFDININTYVKQAYECKKYAFVTDYVRLYALLTEGGIYMDTDVEVIKDISEFLIEEAFSGFQTLNELPTGIMGARAGNQWIKENLEVYNGKRFVKENGELDLTPNTTTITNISVRMGIQLNGKLQSIDNVVTIFPMDYFCAKNYKDGKISITDNTYTIHHFSGSWLSNKELVKKKIRSLVGHSSYEWIKRRIKK
ncbi:MAG: glycosyltransferase [Tissierellaceae bacterium]|nr:glycosyltransferase [Tissierellaceae bacterium]